MPKGVKGFQKGHIFLGNDITRKKMSDSKKNRIIIKKGKSKNCLTCSKSFYVYPYRLNNAQFCSKVCFQKSGLLTVKGKIMNEIQKRKISKKALERVANGCHNWWQGGKTEQNRQIRNSLEYKLWRTAVFTRDNFTCVWCGLKFIKGITGNVILQVDHIKPFCDYPELRFAIDNGRTLCVECHRKTDTWGKH